MTLSERNAFFKAGIVFCACFTLLIIIISFLIVPVYPTIEENSRRPGNFFQIISGLFLGSSFYAVHASLVIAVLFSFAGLFLIHSFFERTSVPEILYVSFFILSFSFEIIRLVLPLHLIYNFPSLYLLGASRVLFFARYFSVFSLFTAGIYAAGLEVQKTRNIIFVLVITVLIISLGVPIDVQTWDTSLNMANGFSSMFTLIEIAALITTVISFFIAVKVRGSGDYVYVGIGVLLAMTGRSILLGTDNWAGPVPGILLLAFGTWFICSKLHRIHLWL
jgi:hypothetical protein